MDAPLKGSSYVSKSQSIFSSKSCNKVNDEVDENVFHDSSHDLLICPTFKNVGRSQIKCVVNKENDLLGSRPAASNANSGRRSSFVVDLVKWVGSGFWNFVLQIVVWILDLILDVICHKGVQDVFMVTFSAVMEVFVTLVCALSTILVTIVVQVDDAYKKCQDVNLIRKKQNKLAKDPPTSHNPKMRPSMMQQNLDQLNRSEIQSTDITEGETSQMQEDSEFSNLDTDLSIADTPANFLQIAIHKVSVKKCPEVSLQKIVNTPEIKPGEQSDAKELDKKNVYYNNKNFTRESSAESICSKPLTVTRTNVTKPDVTEKELEKDENVEAKIENEEARSTQDLVNKLMKMAFSENNISHPDVKDSSFMSEISNLKPEKGVFSNKINNPFACKRTTNDNLRYNHFINIQ